MSKYHHQDVSAVPSGWKVRTVKAGAHRVRVAFPPGRRQTGSGQVVSVLHPKGENPTCSAMKNPAELLLMGANPMRSSSRSSRLNPMFNANFTEDEKMALGRLGIKWSAIQTQADVRRARKALKTMEKARQQFGNPSMPMSEQRERAAEIYSGFHATEHENKIVMDEPHIPAGAYPELGLLYQVYFKPTNPKAEDHYEKVYVCEKENTHVIGTLDREQIYFAGGDQKLDDQMLRGLGWNGEDRFHIGEARKIVYLAYKYHDAVPKEGRGKLVEWIHEFGEETGVRPQLWYDHGNARLYLKHGEYEIQNEGIVN